MGTTFAAVIALLCAVYSIAVGGCPISSPLDGSCCEIRGNEAFKFSTHIISKSGVYNISNFCGECGYWADGYCDATSGGGGWLVIQRRIQKYSVNFHRKWDEYENGFGDLSKEFWYGLHPIHCLTNSGTWELRIDFTFTNGTKSYLQYKQFSVGSADSQYQLNISGFEGITPSDPFVTHPISGQPFSTVDRLNHGSCARRAHSSNSPGGWWYSHCYNINLNYNYGGSSGFMYLKTVGYFKPSFVEMKIRPHTCNV